ncbi:uncharacterized protein LOC143055694 [Mytilus galloprovincialis]|uniref:uncharacterized protein LOC143055694 n=1 Tax=Mytilus galloprovincialis TaxID=29158 RepID=UPI003F7B35DA
MMSKQTTFCYILFFNFNLALMVKITNVTGGVYQKNRISNTHVIKASEMIGPKGCVKDCMMYADCNAVNFHKDRFYCELLDDSYSDHEAENKYGVYFTNISEWTKDNDACWPKTCPTKTRCFVAYKNERLCLPFDTPCDNNQCQNGASCINSVRDYSCRCLAGYYGQYCELTPCSSGPCKNAGTCSISGSTYTCTCRHGYYGTQCQFDACSPNPCQNLGTCFPSGGSSYNCACSSGWYESICNISPCFPNPCYNGGICTAYGPYSYYCTCHPSYTGTTCLENKNSCHGRCGTVSGYYNCQCDANCLAYGNCCVDKVIYCG